MKQPNAAPARSYCMERSKGRLGYVFLALFFLLLGASGLLAFFFQQEEEWYARVFFLALGLGMTAAGLYEGFAAVREFFFPEKGLLARSIRAQLPRPEEAPALPELFALVDRDIDRNGRWFGKIAVGEEWVLGDEVSRIPNLRGIFTKDETHHYNGKAKRTLALLLVDNRWQLQSTYFMDPQDMYAAAELLRLRQPDARTGNGNDCTKFLSLSEEQREEFLREFDWKQGQRAMEEFRRPQPSAVPGMVLQKADGSNTSQVTPQLLQEQIRLCMAQGGSLRLFPTVPIPLAGGEMDSLFFLPGQDGSRFLLLTLHNSPQGFVRPAGEAEALQVMGDLLTQGVLPSLEGWEQAAAQRSQPQESAPPKLAVTERGALRQWERFTAEDVKAAAEGFVEGKYQLVHLAFHGFLLFTAEAGDSMDGRCTVEVTRADPDELRFFRQKCTHRQAAAWLLEFLEGRFRPDYSQWKDVTREKKKQAEKQRK